MSLSPRLNSRILPRRAGPINAANNRSHHLTTIRFEECLEDTVQTVDSVASTRTEPVLKVRSVKFQGDYNSYSQTPPCKAEKLRSRKVGRSKAHARIQGFSRSSRCRRSGEDVTTRHGSGFLKTIGLYISLYSLRKGRA